METTPSELRAPLGFTRAEDVFPDEKRAGLLRARTRPLGGDPAVTFDYRSCVLRDCLGSDVDPPGLELSGFEAIELSGNAPLQVALGAVRAEDWISDATAAAIRESLNGAELPLADGKRLRVEHVADDGMIHRRAGPNGMEVNPEGMDGANRHGGAAAIHGDQDVFGTPLKQMMKGGAPEMFRHRTPDARNDESSLFLLNLWIPIQQITRPLVLMDRDTLDAKRHQILYGLPVTSFLDRDEESRVNDIWTFLPDPDQAWYFCSEMGPDHGYVFDTLGEPHGACILPGEDAVEQLYHELSGACDAAAAGDEVGLQRIAKADRPALPEVTTTAIRQAVRRMTDLLGEAGTRASEICRASEDFTARARHEMDAVIRKSVEMRLVATLTNS